MKYLISLLLFTAVLVSCEKNPEPTTNFADAEYLIFGQFYGLCVGEQCVEIFRADDNGLSEDRNDDYPSRTDFYEGQFESIDIDPSEISDLLTTFPVRLFDEEQIVWGCPDCADQGGYYIELALNDGRRRFWIFDTDKDQLPEYMHDYIDLVQEAINAINE